MRTHLKHFFLMAGAVSMMVMSFKYFFHEDVGILKAKDLKTHAWFLYTFRFHVGCGLLAITSGVIQLVKIIRIKFPSFHRYLGRVYVTAVFCSSITGLAIAQFAIGGIISSVGFSVLSLVWFCCTLMAFTSIRAGDISAHRNWMIRSYALTFASITQRTLLLVPLLTDISFVPVYQISAWAPWIFNLLFAELIVLGRNRIVENKLIGSKLNKRSYEQAI